MRDFRGDGGREAVKPDEHRGMEWKSSGGSERAGDATASSSMRTERKDGREQHRGEGGRDGAGGKREGRGGSVVGSVVGGGENAGAGSTRERKPEDSRLGSGGGAVQETGEGREGWGSRAFLKSAGASHGEDGEVGEAKEDGGGGSGGGGGEGAPAVRFDDLKRKREDRGESRGANTVSGGVVGISGSESREERQREKSERRGGGDLQVHIPFVPGSSSASQSGQREKEREWDEKGGEREREKDESNNNNNSKQREKSKEKDEPGANQKASIAVKESNEDGRREKDGDGVGGHGSSRRKEAAEQQENNPSPNPVVERAAVERVERRISSGSQNADMEHEAGSSVPGSGNAAGRSASASASTAAQEDISKVGDSEVKERAGGGGEGKEQGGHEKGKGEFVEEEKGKRKLRDYDRAAGPDDVNSNPDAEDYEKELLATHTTQRKRLVRSRVPYQGSSTREVRPRLRVKDPESHPTARKSSDSSALVYRAGEGLQEELRRIRKESEEKRGKLTEAQRSSQAAPTTEICIPAELATSSNRQVQGSQLWGTDVYTDDSDLVAVLIHTGYYAPTSSSPPPSVSELRATVRVLAPQERYFSTQRNSLRSRAWGATSGCAFNVESCYMLKKDGLKIQLEPRLTCTPAFPPTLAPAVTERTITTRAVSMNAYRAQRFLQEVTVQYSLCNEPWLKYTMNFVADKGLKKSQYTSARIKKSDVLYVETLSQRYELSYEDNKSAGPQGEAKTNLERGKEKVDAVEKGAEKGVEKGGGQVQAGGSKESVEKSVNNHNNGTLSGDKYRWALCRRPLTVEAMQSKGVPLSPEFVKVIEHGLGWEEVQWSPSGVCVRGKEYPLTRARFVPLHD